MTPWLSDIELAELCEPLTQPAAQIRFLARAGYHVTKRPNGRPLLMRTELERVAGAGRLEVQNPGGKGPDRGALLSLVRGKRGTQAQGR